MKNKLFALLLLFSLPVVAQDKVKLYDEMCDPLQAVFCDYVRTQSQTSRISNSGGEYIGTLIDYKFYGWGLFRSSSGVESYGQYRDGKLLFGLLISRDVVRVGSDEHYVMYDLSTGEIIRLHTKEGDLPLEYPLVASSEGLPSPYSFKRETYKNGDVYVGEFFNGRRHGYGVYIWSNGDLWYGNYCGGYRDGYGMLVKPDHRVYYGKWVGDTKVE
jgi:hypothetical protein